MKFDSHSAELHLGILQNRMQRLKGKMNACMLKMDNEVDMKGVDKELEKYKFEECSRDYDRLEKEANDYEEKVLQLTKL